jgi:hypothetical protein
LQERIITGLKARFKVNRTLGKRYVFNSTCKPYRGVIAEDEVTPAIAALILSRFKLDMCLLYF